MPLVSDRGALTRDNALAANAMLENGVRVFIYPGMSHVKAAVYDGWACVGSANFDRWSLKINREMNVATSDPESVEELLERVFAAKLVSSAILCTGHTDLDTALAAVNRGGLFENALR